MCYGTNGRFINKGRCYHFLRNRCSYGDRCRKCHCCKFYATGICRDGIRCRFTHMDRPYQQYEETSDVLVQEPSPVMECRSHPEQLYAVMQNIPSLHPVDEVMLCEPEVKNFLQFPQSSVEYKLLVLSDSILVVLRQAEISKFLMGDMSRIVCDYMKLFQRDDEFLFTRAVIMGHLRKIKFLEKCVKYFKNFHTLREEQYYTTALSFIRPFGVDETKVLRRVNTSYDMFELLSKKGVELVVDILCS